MSIKDRSHLTTEKRNPRTEQIDTLPTQAIVDMINSEDLCVAAAVGKERMAIARAVDMIVHRFREGGRLFYVGAGTSGRLGVLDASECPPTFGVNRSLVQGIIAGGRRALVRSIEGAEDHEDDGQNAVVKKKIRAADTVVGIAACGLTPFVRGALKEARRLGAGTIFITCAPEAVNQARADIVINPVVGPEVVTGSTRMKAGTATKLVLNTLTTAAMIRMGKTHGNLMVDLKATNEKLKDRSRRIVTELTGLPSRKAEALLKQAQGHLKTAIVMHFKNTTPLKARQILKRNDHSLRKSIE
ncbi:MAG: N-acetylmuramic acid 6-phosphate etherase [Phycisphaerae bacterium]|nr:N-acetylmuramic acid 6-phosphate etherase [Phycisphaerae bacterium]